MFHPLNLREWLSGLDGGVLNAATVLLLTLEGAGVPGVPGVLPMLAQVAAIDAGHATLGSAIGYGVLGNTLGSALGYGAGRLAGRWLPAAWREGPPARRAADLLARRGGPLIVVSRTVGSLRTPVTLVAGQSRYPFGRYMALSLLGALVHVGVWQTLLWRFGPALLPRLEGWGREILLGVVLFAVTAVVWRWRRGREGSPPVADS